MAALREIDSPLFDEVVVVQTWQRPVEAVRQTIESPMKPRFRAYDPQRDIDRMQQAATSAEQAHELAMVDVNWRTFLAELYGVAVYKATYRITPVDLIDTATNESIFTIIQSGVNAAKEAELSKEDILRNEAEGVVFSEVHEQVRSGLVAEGGVFVYPTLQGSQNSVFQGNYVDLLIKRGEELKLERYATELDPPQMAQVVNGITGTYHYPHSAEALDLKRKAVYVGNLSIASLKQNLKLGRSTVSDERIAEVRQTVLPLNEEYKQELRGCCRKAKLEELYTAIIALANDVVAGKQVRFRQESQYYPEQSYAYDNHRFGVYPVIDMDYYGSQKLRYQLLPCGEVGGEGVAMRIDGFGFTDVRFASAIDMGLRPDLLSQVSTKTEKSVLPCTCPFCNKKVNAKIENGKITCPRCNKSAPYQC